MTCKQCGSHAINPHLHGRDGSDGDLCDVCYWRKRAEDGAQPSAKPVQLPITDLQIRHVWDGMPLLTDKRAMQVLFARRVLELADEGGLHEG